MSNQVDQPQKPLASGVDELIARLREEGVEAGLNEANEILANARAQARQIIDSANAEARERLQSTHKEVDAYQAAGEQALKTAMRDMVLEMKAVLTKGFSADVKRLVSHHLHQPEILKQMILEVAARTRDRAGVSSDDPLQIILPEHVVGLEELRSNPEALEKGLLTDFVFGLTKEMLQDGVTFSTSQDIDSGIQVKLVDKDIALDLTETAVADLLLAHLQPRFRAILEGVVK